tara:strand:+ start:3155 stop:3640 length:486 start_codon:yes stop_codon:yes gene_type:complete
MSSLSVGKKNKTGDSWYTPKSAFEEIAHLIPKDKVIFECFYGNGMSGKYLTELGFEVIHENLDFFEPTPFTYDIIVSNPPYTSKSRTFKRLRELDVPFMLLLPVSCITKQYTKKYFLNDLQMVIPSKRIHFVRGGEQSKSSWFDVCWLCYKMGFPRDITYL